MTDTLECESLRPLTTEEVIRLVKAEDRRIADRRAHARTETDRRKVTVTK